MVRDSFLKKLYINLKRYPCLLGKHVAMAVSGGVDSMVLLNSVYMLKDSPLLGDIKFSVITIDHGVRDDAQYEVEYVKGLSHSYGFQTLVFHIKPERTSEHYLHNRRMEIWKEVITNYGVDKIWLAHHKDDVIEHVLLQLMRGEEIRGLTSLKRCSDFIGRPLLDFSKDEILAFAHRHEVNFFEDITNSDTTIPRNFIRHKIIPLLKERFDVNNIWRSYKGLSLQRDVLNTQIENFVRNHAKISENVAVISGSWPIVVEASIFILKRWGISPSGRLVERLGDMDTKNMGSRIVWRNITIIKTNNGVKIIRGD